jgi:glycosyltransferase involved in cell wall biosynthesis
LIIVDDGSTDNTKEVIKGYNDGRIRYIYQDNAERSAARNNGIENAQGEYICFLDSDDYFLPERLEKLYEFIQKESKPQALIFTDVQYVKEGDKLTVSYKSIEGNQLNYVAQNTIGVPQVCIYHSLLQEHYFNTKFNIGEDTELWLRIADKYPIIYQKNNATFVATDHSERSVNLKKNNSPAEQRQTLKYMFTPPHPGAKVDKKLQKRILANSFFNSAKHFMYNGKKINAILNVLKSICIDINSVQLKHRLYCLLNLILVKIPTEYIHE